MLIFELNNNENKEVAIWTVGRDNSGGHLSSLKAHSRRWITGGLNNINKKKLIAPESSKNPLKGFLNT